MDKNSYSKFDKKIKGPIAMAYFTMFPINTAESVNILKGAIFW